MLVGSEAVGQFPMDFLAVNAYELPDDINAAFPSFQQHNSITAILIKQLFCADRTVGYGTAFN